MGKAAGETGEASGNGGAAGEVDGAAKHIGRARWSGSNKGEARSPGWRAGAPSADLEAGRVKATCNEHRHHQQEMDHHYMHACMHESGDPSVEL